MLIFKLIVQMIIKHELKYVICTSCILVLSNHKSVITNHQSLFIITRWSKYRRRRSVVDYKGGQHSHLQSYLLYKYRIDNSTGLMIDDFQHVWFLLNDWHSRYHIRTLELSAANAITLVVFVLFIYSWWPMTI